MVIDLLKWKARKKYTINTSLINKHDQQLLVPLLAEHIIPNTECQFMIECYDSQFIYLRTVATGERQILIHGSVNNPKGLPSLFFLSCGHGDYELHFPTVTRENGNIVHTWYRWYLGQDFFYTLNKYGGLPLE